MLLGGYSTLNFPMRLLKTGLGCKQGEWRIWKRTREEHFRSTQNYFVYAFFWQNAMDEWVGNFQNEIKTVSRGNKTKIT